MARQIFIVGAHIVGSDGTFYNLDGYPVIFDSNSYSGDIDKTQRRAEGAFSECWGAMCKRDDRMIQTVTLSTVDGFLLDVKTSGHFPGTPPEE